MTDKRWLLWLLGLVILVDASLLVGPYVWDDAILVETHRETSRWSGLLGAFQTDLWSGAGSEGEFPTSYYRPMMIVSLIVDRITFGLNPLAHRIHSLGWHLLTVGLLWHWLRTFRPDPRAATVAAAVYALHPLHIDMVRRVASRNDSMAIAGLLGMLLLFSNDKTGSKGLFAGATCTLFALFSKETAVMAPFLLLVADLARFGRPGRWTRYGALAGVLGLWGLARHFADVGAPSLPALDTLPAAFLQALSFYSHEFWVPVGVNPAANASAAAFHPWALGGMVLLWVGLGFRAPRFALAGLVFAGIAFAPGLLATIHADMLAQRYVALPLVGLGLAVHGALPTRLHPWIVGAGSLLIAVSSIPSHATWKSSETLFAHAYELQPGPSTACALFSVRRESHPRETVEPLLLEGLGPPPTPHCCLWASQWFVSANRTGDATKWGERALDQGCEPSGELVAPLSLAHALEGEWQRAETLAEALQRDPFGYRAIILSAAALRRGDESVLHQWAGEDESARNALRQRVDWLLETAESGAPRP